MAHTQGKRHQTNLAKRAAREAKEAPAQPQPHKRKVNVRKTGMSSHSFLFLLLVYGFYAVMAYCCVTIVLGIVCGYEIGD